MRHEYKGRCVTLAECDCHDHADSCTFNMTLGDSICDECYHNTTGDHCDQCVDGLYRNMSTSLDDPNLCQRQYPTSSLARTQCLKEGGWLSKGNGKCRTGKLRAK